MIFALRGFGPLLQSSSLLPLTQLNNDCTQHSKEHCSTIEDHCISSGECQGTYQGRHGGEAERVSYSGSSTHHAERRGIRHSIQEQHLIMTNNYFVDSCVAIVLGTGIGLLLSVGAQKVLNKHYKATCHDQPGHNLIYTKGFLGDTYYCINSKYMN